MKKAIVSGANGFVGSALVRELLGHGYEVTALDREGNNGNLPDDARVSFVGIDLAEIGRLADVIQRDGYDAFYHLAWAGSSGAARGDIGLQLRNVAWAADSLRVAKGLGCSRFVCTGSIMEHEAAAVVCQQGNKPEPGNIYGGAKLAAHIMCMSAAASMEMDIVWAEITNAYGPGELSPRLVNTAIRKCIKGEAPRFTSGTQNYDFVYIDDVARALRMIAENGRPFHKYIIGSSQARPLKEFLLEMREAIAPGLDFLFGDVPFQGAALPMESFSCEATERDTGFRAEVPFVEGVRRTMEWLRIVEGIDGSTI